jgi:hypothetical protein
MDFALQILQDCNWSADHGLENTDCISVFVFADHCDMCKKYFDKSKTEVYSVYYDDAPHSFCCKTCMNVYILANRKIVPCNWCKVRMDLLLCKQKIIGHVSNKGKLCIGGKCCQNTYPCFRFVFWLPVL